MATTFQDGYEIELSDELCKIEAGPFKELVIGGVRSLLDPTVVGTVAHIPKLVNIEKDISAEIKDVLFRTFKATIQSLFQDEIEPDARKKLREESLIEWNTEMRQSDEVITVTKSDLRYPGSSKFCVQAYIILSDTCAHYGITFEHGWLDFARMFSAIYSHQIQKAPETLDVFRNESLDIHVNDEKNYYAESLKKVNQFKARTSILSDKEGANILLSEIEVPSEIRIYNTGGFVESNANNLLPLFLGSDHEYRLSILEADRGMGKSVLLERLFMQLQEEVSGQSNIFIIKPNDIGGFSGKVCDWKALFGKYEIELSSRLKSRRIYLLIDSVFEVFHGEAQVNVWNQLLEVIIEEHPQLFLITTCRKHGLDKRSLKNKDNVQVLEINGYLPDELKKYVEKVREKRGEVCPELEYIENQSPKTRYEEEIIKLATSPMYVDLIEIRGESSNMPEKQNKIALINDTIELMVDKAIEIEKLPKESICSEIEKAPMDLAIASMGLIEQPSIPEDIRRLLKKISCFTVDLYFVHDSFKEALAMKFLSEMFISDDDSWTSGDFDKAVQIIHELLEKEDTKEELTVYLEYRFKSFSQENTVKNFISRFFKFYAKLKEGRLKLSDSPHSNIYGQIRVVHIFIEVYNLICANINVEDINFRRLGRYIDDTTIWLIDMKDALKETEVPFYFVELGKDTPPSLLRLQVLKLINPELDEFQFDVESWKHGKSLTIESANKGAVSIGKEIRRSFSGKSSRRRVPISKDYEVEEVKIVDSSLSLKLLSTEAKRFLITQWSDIEAQNKTIKLILSNAKIGLLDCTIDLKNTRDVVDQLNDDTQKHYTLELKTIAGKSIIRKASIDQFQLHLFSAESSDFVIEETEFNNCHFTSESSFKGITLKKVTFNECEFTEESILSISNDSEQIHFNACWWRAPDREISKDREDISNRKREFLKFTTNTKLLLVKDETNNTWTFQEDKSMEQHQVLTECKERVKAELEVNIMKSLQTLGKYLKPNSGYTDRIYKLLDEFDTEAREVTKSTIEDILDDLSFEDIKLEYAFSDKMYDHICVIAPASAHEEIKKNDFPKNLFPNSSFADSAHSIPKEAKILVFYAKKEDLVNSEEGKTPWEKCLSDVLNLSISESNKRYVLLFTNGRSNEISNEKYKRNTVSANSYIPLYARLRELQDHIRQRAALQLDD